MDSNGTFRSRKFSEDRADPFANDPYAVTTDMVEKGTDNISLDSSTNSEELNPPPPVKFPPRNISAVESRLLNLATKERPTYRRHRPDDSSSDNESPDKKNKAKSPARRSSQASSPTRRRSPSPKPQRNHSPRKSRSKSPKRKTRSPERRRARSPDKKKSRSPERKKTRSPKRRSRSPKKRSVSPAAKSKHSPREKRRSRSRSTGTSKHRRSSSRSPPRRKKSRSPRRKRSRSRSNERRRSRSRSHGKRRSRSRSRDRKNGSRKRHSRSRSRSPRFTSKWGQRPSSGICRAVLPSGSDDKKSREVTTEDVEKRLAQHMKTVQEKAAEEAKKINLPGYLNPAMVNVHQFKQVQDKRKLLWGKKDEKAGESKWAGAFGDSGNDDKFRRLMGIQETNAEGTSEAIQQSRKVLDDLEKEYEKSRAFQLSRGAGGLTGIGLGFGSAVQPPQ